MSDTKQEQPKKAPIRRERPAAPVRPAALDAATATKPDLASLAEAVREAESAKVVKIEAAPRPQAPATPSLHHQAMTLARRHGTKAAALAIAVSLGWIGGSAGRSGAAPLAETQPAAPALVVDWGTAGPLSIRQGQMDSGRFASEVKAVGTGLVAVRAGLDGLKQDGASRSGDLAQRLARIERAEADANARLAQLAERLAQPERDDGTAARLIQVLDRLERLEQSLTQAANAPAKAMTASLPQPAAQPPVMQAAPQPAATGSLPEAKPSVKTDAQEPKADVIAGWYLRSVHRGVALVEGRRGLVEVRAGDLIPGLGRVEAVEKRGREWFVVTARGLIATEAW